MADQSTAGAAGRVATVAEGDRSARARLVILLLCVALVVSVLLSLTSGASDASAVGVVGDWLAGAVTGDAVLSARDRLIVYDIRLPRVLLGVLIGAALAVSGAVMQGLF
ncbi:MAG: iron ABC transporter, partial [Mesorhizobium sp.]